MLTPLHSPQMLELTAADELLAVENIDVLRQNGFELEVSEERAPGQRVKLAAQAISKSTVFDVKGERKPFSRVPARRCSMQAPADLEELLHLMQDRPAGQMVRCSKARAMFAMRACRKSIMIGTPLNRRQMTLVRCIPYFRPNVVRAGRVVGRRGAADADSAPAALLPGRTAHGDDGPTLALPPRATDHAPPVGHCGVWVGSSERACSRSRLGRIRPRSGCF